MRSAETAPSGKPTPTLRDVGLLAGVNPSVVSRVLNDEPTLKIKPATRERIREAAALLGYVPNVAARSLRTARVGTIGALVPDLRNQIYAELVQGADSRASELSYVVLVGAGQTDGSSWRSTYSRLAQSGRVDGLLISTSSIHDDLLGSLTNGEVPVVLVNRRHPSYPHSVSVRDDEAMRLAVSHLWTLGHGAIGHVAGASWTDTGRRRSGAFVNALKELGAGSDPPSVEGDFDEESGDQSLRRLLKLARVSAVVFSSLRAAVGGLRAARDLRLSVPGDLSIVAIHDLPIAQYVAPSITTVSLPVYKMGRVAVDALLELITGGAPGEIVVSDDPQLIVRESSGPLSN